MLSKYFRASTKRWEIFSCSYKTMRNVFVPLQNDVKYFRVTTKRGIIFSCHYKTMWNIFVPPQNEKKYFRVTTKREEIFSCPYKTMWNIFVTLLWEDICLHQEVFPKEDQTFLRLIREDLRDLSVNKEYQDEEIDNETVVKKPNDGKQSICCINIITN